MFCRWCTVACCLISSVILPASVLAQDWSQPWSDSRDRPARVDVSGSVGMLAPTDWGDLVLLGSISSVSGVLEQVLVRDLRVKPDTVYGASVTYWRGRYGFRTHAALSRSSLLVGGASLGGIQSGEERELTAARVNTWFYDVRGAIGLTDYSPGRNVWPYAFVGLGAITYDLDRTITPPLLTFIERGTARPGRPDLVIADDGGRQFIVAVNELGLETTPAVNFGVGTDFRLPLGPAGLAIRVEVSDHMANSPMRLRIRELSGSGGLASDSDVRFGAVHHLRAAAAFVVQIGR